MLHEKDVGTRALATRFVEKALVPGYSQNNKPFGMKKGKNVPGCGSCVEGQAVWIRS